jgi:TPR repeat protein
MEVNHVINCTSPSFKSYARTLFLALCLLQSASYAYASQDLTDIRRMAEQGNADAQFSLAVAYDQGFVVTRYTAQAVGWFRKAAEKGNVAAQKYIDQLG